MRTVAGKRNGRTYTPEEAVAFMMKWFPEDRAKRIVDITMTFGIKAEALPKGWAILRLAPGRITIEVDE